LQYDDHAGRTSGGGDQLFELPLQGALASAVGTAVGGGARGRGEEQPAQAGGAEQGDEGGAPQTGPDTETKTVAKARAKTEAAGTRTGIGVRAGSGPEWHEGPGEDRWAGGTLSIGRDLDDARASLRYPADRAREPCR
jgi:hypothetical protein